MNKRPKRVAEVFHPAEYILDEIEARHWSLPDLAKRMGGDWQRDLLALEIYMTVRNPGCLIGKDSARRLALAFGVSTRFFLTLETAWLAGLSEGAADRTDTKRLDDFINANPSGVIQL